MFNILKQKTSWHLVLFLLAIVIFIIYWATSGGATPYNYFTRLAIAFLHGKYYLDINPPWLNELIPIANGKFAVVYPPAPAIISIPFVLIFGTNFEQQILSQIMGALATFVWGVIAYNKSRKKIVSFWVFLLVGLGNIIWYLSSNGSVWYTGQVSGFLFLSLSIYESLNKRRLPLTILYFSLAFLSRLQVILAIPIILYLNWNLLKYPKKLISFILGLSSFGIIYGVYNYARFGSFIETGYSLIPGVLKEPWYEKGLFSYSYAISNLKIMFASLPIIKNTFPYITPSWGGLAIWITSPAFIYALAAKIKHKQNLVTWISLLLVSFVIFFHGGTGFTQFGYRYAVDFYPLILLLIVEVVSKSKIRWHHWVLLSLSIVVNFWGVIYINKLGYVGW
jgi:hypothetical protein